MIEELNKLSFPQNFRGILVDRVGEQYLVLRQLCNTPEQVNEVIDEALQKLNDSIKPKVNY